MGLSNITFITGSGGLGRPLPGEDHFSGFVFYTNEPPSGFNTPVKKILSLQDAEALGINLKYLDETDAVATYEITTIGATNDVVAVSIQNPDDTTVVLGSYTKKAGETTDSAVATKLAAAINALSTTTGYFATVNGAIITVIPPSGLGVFLNTKLLTIQSTGGITGTNTAFSGGIASKVAVFHYHISEFFRIQPKGVLFVGIFPIPTQYTFTEIANVQTFANGAVRQVGVYKEGAFATADLTAIDLLCKAQDLSHKPLVAIYAANLFGANLTTILTDLNLLNANNVSANISQDGAATGAELYETQGKSITTLGAQLGAVALAKVNEDIAWVQKFNMSNGTELETLAFANGLLLSDVSVNDNTLDLFDLYRYVFLRKYIGYSGSYWNAFNMAIGSDSDYAFGEDNRTIQKAKRGIYKSLLPVLGGPLVLNSDGTLSNNTLAYLDSAVRPNLDQMIRDAEISAYQPLIDPNQNISTTGKLVVAIEIVADGVARQIEVPIGYVQSLS